MRKYIILLILSISFYQMLLGQDPARFQEEIDVLKQLNIERIPNQKVILFTGSSSINMWNDIQDYFPGKVIINTGFGGSHMSDLLFYLEDIVIKYKPDQIFIYEGDNDIASGKKPSKILKDTKKIVQQLNKALPSVPIVLISPKPSLARWELKQEYGELNQRFERYATKHDQIDFINVWPLMLNEEGEPIKELFIEDGLHMSKPGYNLWAGEIIKFIQ
jgi:lysophospholipase L1-like esterase